MDETHLDENAKPRHIRDIAHLYISRIRRGNSDFKAAVFLCGARRDCFPSLHASNIIAGISIRAGSGAAGHHIRVFELSGLLPNIGYFFSLAPRHYLAMGEKRETGSIPLFRNSEISFELPDDYDPSLEPADRVIDVVHLPPLESASEFSDAFDAAKRIFGDKGVFLLMSGGEPAGEVHQAGIIETLKGFLVCELNVRSGEGRAFEQGANYSYLGSIHGWKKSLLDRFPIIVRNPGCPLSRMYTGTCESLLYRLRKPREGSDAAGRGGLAKSIEARR